MHTASAAFLSTKMRDSFAKLISTATSFAMIASTFVPLVAFPITAAADTVAAGDVVINEFVSHPSSGSEWVELYNTTGTAIDFSANNWKIQDRTFTGSTPTGTATTTITSGTLPANGFLAVDVSGLNDNGDIITLFDDSGNQIDQVVYGTVTGYTADVAAPDTDQSAYRTTDGGSTWAVTDTPTKGTTNLVTVPDTTAPTEPVASPDHGFYFDTQTVTLSSTDNSGATPTIYYTTDGSTPSDTNGTKYSGPISVTSPGESIEAIAYDAAGNKSTVGVYSYVIIPSITLGTAELTVQSETAVKGAGITLDATLTENAFGVVVHPSGATIEFSINGTDVGSAQTDGNGEATFVYTPSPAIIPGSYPGGITASTDVGPFGGVVTGTADLTVTGAVTPPTDPVEDTTNSTYFSTIADAIASSTTNAGDTIALLSDLTVPSQIDVNKEVTIDGQGHTVSLSGTGYRFLITGDGTTLKDMNITKTDKTGVQNIVGIQADNVTVDGVDFTGQYAAGDNDVSRALEISGNDFTIENSSFKNLRQPAYINSYTGSVTNNYTDGTKGWVVVQDSNVTFSGNTWGTNATDIAIIQQGTGANHYTCAITAQIRADNNNATVDNQVDSSCAPVLNAENFNTVDDSTYKGISVGFDAKDFGTVTAVTVDMKRADGTDAIKHGTQDLFDLISGNTAPYQFTAPFVITAGTYDPSKDSYWTSDATTWSDATTPTSVTITVTGSNGTESVTNSNFSQGAPSWPTYESLLPPTPPAAPENVNLTQSGNTYACGTGTYFNGSSSVYGTHLNWTLPAGETETGYKVVPTYPSGSHGTAYTWTSGTSVWIGANIGQGYGAAPNDQGTYSYSITYKDLLGNWSDPATCAFVYDTVAPTVSVTPDTSAALSGTVTFNITINDANAATSSNKAIYVYLYNTKDGSQKLGQKVDLSSGTGSFTVDTTKLADGTYNLDVGVVKDAAGNPSGAKDNYFSGYTIANGLAAPTNLYAKFQYDTNNIADGATLNKTASTTGNNLLLGWKAPTGAVAGYHVLTTYPDGTTKLSYQGANNWAWIVAGEAFGSQQGKYTFQVEAVDGNGIVSPLSAPFTLSYDTHSPTAHFDPVPPEYVNGNFTVSGTAQDNVALKGVLFDVRDPNAKGNQWIAGCVAGTQTTTWGAASTTAQTSCTINTSKLTEGYSYILRIHAGDYANYGGGEQQTLILDKTAPTITVKDGYTGDLATNTFSDVSFKLHDNNAVDYYVLNGHKHDLSNNAWSDANFQNIKGQLNAGSNTITVYDVAGNSTSYTFTYEPAGLVYVTTDAATNITPTDATLNGTNGISDAEGHSFWVSTSTIDTSSSVIPSGVYSTTDFGAIAAHTDFTALLSSLTAADGAYVHGQTLGSMPAITAGTTYHYVAWSNVGGTWHPGVEQMFTTGLEAPTITSPFDGESTTTAGWQNITWTAVSSTNGPVTYTYQASGSNATSADGSFSSPLVTTSGITTTSISQGNTGDGTYYMHIMATDNAGNTSAWGPTVKVIVDNSGNSGGGTTLTYTFATSTVTIGNPSGWTQSVDAGGNVAFLPDINAPLGNGALELTTTGDNNSVTHFTHDFDIPLSDLTAISYGTKQLAATDKANGNITLRVNVNLDGTSNTVDDQLMYEPYYNGFDGTTMTGWNAWNISTTTGKFWSNKNLTYNGLGGVSAGSYASNFTLADVLHDHPNAKIIGLVLSMGTWNPSQNVLADDLLVSELDGTNASTTVFDFEPRTGTVTTITNANDLQTNASTAGDPVTVEWKVDSVSGTGTPTGTVTVFVNGSAASGCTANVSATECSFTPSAPGSTTIYAQYNGDSSFDQSDTKSSTLTHMVNAAGGNNNNTNGANSGGTGGTGGSNGSPVGNSLIGDINRDGRVDFIDFALLMSAMGQRGNGLAADLNNNGSVGVDDLAIFFANWKI